VKAKTGVKNDRAEWKLEGKLPPFFTFIFFSMVFFFVFFYFLLFEKKKMPGESIGNRRVEAGTKSEKVE
jgi:hypothetical protein